MVNFFTLVTNCNKKRNILNWTIAWFKVTCMKPCIDKCNLITSRKTNEQKIEKRNVELLCLDLDGNLNLTNMLQIYIFKK